MPNKDTYHDQEQDRRICFLEEHYSKFNDEMGEVRTDVKWLKQNHWIVVSASVGAFITAVINVILK